MRSAMNDLIEALSALEARVSALEARPDTPNTRATDEALRRQARQTSRHMHELVATSKALGAKAASLERDARALISRELTTSPPVTTKPGSRSRRS